MDGIPCVRGEVMIEAKWLRGCLCVALFLLVPSLVFAQSPYTSVQSGDWNDDNTWSGTGIPTAGDSVTIVASHTVTVTGLQNAGQVTLQNSSGNKTLRIVSGGVLTIDGSGTALQVNSSTDGVNLVELDGGSILTTLGEVRLNCPSLGLARINFTTNGGTLTSATDLTFSGTTINDQVIFAVGSPGVFQIAGGMGAGGSVSTNNSGTFRFNGSGGQTINGYTFHDLDINKISGTATLNAPITVNGNLSVTSGVLDDGGSQISLNGAVTSLVTIGTNGVLKLGSAGSTTDFPSPVNGANVTMSPNAAVVYQAGLTGQIINLNVNYRRLFLQAPGSTGPVDKMIGAGTITVLESLQIDDNGSNGVRLVLGPETLDVDGTINGNGEILVTSGSIFIGGHFTSGITFTRAGTTSTVTYDGAGAQNVLGTTYDNLVINKPSGTATLNGITQVDADFTVTAGSFDMAAFNLNTIGNFSNNGSFDGGSGTLTLQGASFSNNGFFNGNIGTVMLVSGSPQSWGGSSIANLNVFTSQNTSGVSFSQSVNVYDLSLAATGNFTVSPGKKISVLSGGSIANGGGAYIRGALEQVLAASTLRNFPVGTPSGYANVEVTPNASGAITVEAVAGTHPSATSGNILSRYWTLSNVSGFALADLVFHYNVADVTGTESSYVLGRHNVGWSQFSAVDNVTHKAAQTNVSGLNGDWTAGEPASMAPGSTLTVTSLADSGPGTLRDAITTVNSGGCTAPCTIEFGISGTGNIVLSSALPALTANAANLTIDGFSGTGASGNSNPFGSPSNANITVSLDGNNAVPIGLEIQTNFVTIQGLGFRNFSFGGGGEAIKINGGSNNWIRGCYIGTDNSGSTAMPNFDGIVVFGGTATANTIGGPLLDQLNVISGNTTYGIRLTNGSNNTEIKRNYIGVNAAATSALGNGINGIYIAISTDFNRIGTNTVPNIISGHAGIGVEIHGSDNEVKNNFIGLNGAGNAAIPNGAGVDVLANDNYVGGAGSDRNFISGNTNSGIEITGNLNGVSNNYIGVDVTGTVAIPNGGNGIFVSGTAAGNEIGIPFGNLIAHNTLKGIQLATTGIGNVMQKNNVHGNLTGGIDLGGDGPTANDPTDSDSGNANNNQNYPNVSAAAVNGANIDIVASINSSGGVSVGGFLVDVYGADTSSPSQAETYLGQSGCIAGPIFTNQLISVPNGGLVAGDKIVVTATAYTDGTCTTVSEGTSELSPGFALSGDIHWINTGGGSFETASNWSPAVVPGAADNAYIDAVGTYTVTMSGSHTVSGLHVGVAGGTQTLDLAVGTTLTINAPSDVSANGVLALNGNSLTGVGSLDINGVMNWANGSVSGVAGLNINSGATLNLNSGVTKTLADRFLTINSGASVNWTGGNVQLATGGTISNSGTFIISTDSLFQNAGGGGSFTNTSTGILRKNTTSGTTQVSNTIVANNGTLDLQTGTFDPATLNNAGTVAINGGAVLLVNSDVATFSAGSSVSGAGVVQITSAQLTVNANINLPKLQIDGGTVDGTGTFTSDNLAWGGGFLSGSGTTQIQLGQSMTIATAAPKSLSRALVVNGSGTVTVNGAGTLSIGAGGSINNGGLFLVTADMTISGSGQTIANGGTFRKTTGIGTLLMTNLTFNNTSTLDVQSGIVDLASGTSTASFQISTSCEVLINSDTYNLATGASVTGAGKLKLAGGNLNVSTTVPVDNYQQIGGFLGGTGQMQVMIAGDWSAGTMQGGGSTLINGTFSLSGAGGKALDNRTFSVAAAGIVTLNGTGGITFLNGGNIANNGNFIVTADNTFSNGGGAGIFDNTGTFTKQSTTGVTTFSNTGFTNHNIVDLQSGILSVTGAFSQVSGTLKLKFGGTVPGSQFAQLQTAANPSLAGTLQVLLNGPYQPNAGDSFLAVQIATGTHSGTFTPNYPALSGGKTWAENYGATGLLLSVNGVADLTITKSAPSNVTSGAAITYTLTVNNGGPDPAIGASVSDVLQTGHTSITPNGGAAWTCGVVSLTVTCTANSNLATGPAQSITINANAPTAIGPFTNVANVTSSNDPTPGNNSGSAVVNVNPPNADLGVTANATPGPVTTGTPVSYTFTITNGGPATATGVTFNAPIPAGLTFTSSVPSTPTCTFAAGALSCNLGSINNGNFVTVTINATTNAGGTQTVTGTASRTQTDPNSANDSASASIAVSSGGTLIVVNTNDSGSGSLRQALLDAAAAVCTSPCTINFNIPSGPFVIQPLSVLPSLGSGTGIDARTQPGYSGTPIIELDGSLLPAASSTLTLNGPAAKLAGLAVTKANAGSKGIYIPGNSNSVEATYVGLTPAGLAAGNDDGIWIDGNNNTIGGNTAPKRNIISSNTLGVLINGTASGNVVAGNYIGTDPAGTTARANATGVAIASADANTIGGATLAEGNVVAANTSYGIKVFGANAGAIASSNTIRNNWVGPNAAGTASLGNIAAGIQIDDFTTATVIRDNVISGNQNGVVLNGTLNTNTSITNNLVGVAPDGSTAMGNPLSGITITDASNASVGGTGAGEGNVIANNGGNGITILGGALKNTILANSIHDDTNLGIDLAGDGVTVNDATDSDSGPNGKQNAPTLTSATLDGVGGMRITHNIDSSATSANSILVEFFEADVTGEGKTFIARSCFATNSFGAGTSFAQPGFIALGDSVVATATSYTDTACTTPADGTSEFSNAVTVTPCTPPTVTISAPPSVCSLSTGNVASASGGASYSWSITNGTITSGASTPSITFTAGATGVVGLTVNVVDGVGCPGFTTSNVTIVPPPTVTITGPTTSCPSAPITLDAGAGFASYSWSTGAVSQTISVSPNVNTTYSVTVTDGSGCTGTDSHTVTMNPVPTPTITGPTATCAATPVTLDAGSGFASYSWSTGAISQTITVSPASTATYSVTVTNGSGCSGTDSHTVTVTSNPTATLTAPPSVCANSTGNNASTPVQPGGTYAWTISNGTITSSASAAAITFTAGPSGNVVLGVTVTVGSCSSTNSVTIPINPPPVVNITGPTQVCPSSAFILDAGAGFTSYLWSNGATTQSIAVTQAAPSTTYSVTVSNGSCTATDTHVVTLFPTASVTITAPSSALPDTAGLVASVPSTPSATYNWTISNGTITGPTNGNSITFTVGASGTTTLNVSSTLGSCTSIAQHLVGITPAANDQADLGITKTALATTQAGSALVYKIGVTNAGPDTASDVLIVDTLPAGVTLVSIDDGPWNCFAIGNIVNCTGIAFVNDSTSITITVNAPQQGGAITNNVTISSTILDPNPANDHASATTNVIGGSTTCATVPPSLVAPANNANVSSPVALSWSSVSGATDYEVWIVANNLTSLAGTTAGTSFTLQTGSGTSSWFVVAHLGSGCAPLRSSQRTFVISEGGNCATHGSAQITSPPAGSTVSSPLTLSWTPVPQAIGYRVWIEVNGTAAQDIGTTNGAISLTAAVPPGSIVAYVDALFAGCPATRSASITFTVPRPDPCATRVAASPFAPANDSTVNTSSVDFQWSPALGADGYRVWFSQDGTTPAVLGTTTNETSLHATFGPGSVIWWIEALYEGCASTESARLHFTIPQGQGCSTAAPTPVTPQNGSVAANAEVTFTWTSVPGAVSYELWLAAAKGTPALIGTTTGTSLTRILAPGEFEWFVRVTVDRCPPRDSQSARFTLQPPANCLSNARPIAISPLDGAALSSPVDFSWHAPAGATSFELFTIRGNAAPQLVTSTTATQALGVNLAAGNLRWFVRAHFDGCAALDSEERELEIVAAPAPCAPLTAPVINAPGQISSGVPFLIQWTPVSGATAYQLQLAGNAGFTNSETITTTATQHELTRTSTVYARVRAIDGTCQPVPTISAFGPTAIIFILPSSGSEGAAPLTGGIVTFTIPIGAQFAGQTFTATTHDPWLSVAPASGVVAAGGTNLTATANTTGLPIGSSLGTVAITLSTPSSGNVESQGTTVSFPSVSVSLVTPVTPSPKSGPPPDALIIPAVAHADGINSKFQSDVRVSNTSPQLIKYQLTFTPSGGAGISAGKQTTFSIEPGRTVALDDVLKSWFGTGGESTVGTLEIRPLTQTTTSTSSSPLAGLANLVTFAASRTFNLTSNGTFGQYIPAIPYANFVGRSLDLSKPTLLSLQQIAQSDRYRTNLGILEGSGEPASLLVRVFGDSGEKLTEFAINLAGGEHTQLNGFLSQHGVSSLADGRVEIQVLSPGGKVTAYASVLDNQTSDPLLVTPVTLTDTGASRWVVPGVADLNNGFANWQTDMRVFNAGSTPVDATLSFYSQSGGAAKTTNISIPAGQVRQFDKTLASIFGVTNDGGAIHLTTTAAARLITTARTYNQTSTGTYGQFISAVTPAEAAGVGSRPLQILQVEESSRFRSNIGLAEVTGNPVTIELAVVPPDVKFTVVTQLTLQANEFRQIGSLLKTVGLDGTFNARVTVRAISGTGRVTAYASVIDALTNDPTYVPAQ